MAIMWGLDHAANSGIDFVGAKGQGFAFTMRYLTPSRYALDAAERDRIFQAGLGLGLIWELEGNQAMGGAPQGTVDAQRANAAADALGAPATLRLAYCAGDLTPTYTPSDADARGPIAEYCRAFTAASARPVIPYGPYNVIEIICGEHQINRFGWQCAGGSGSGAGSGGSFTCFGDGSVRRLSRYAAMFQDFGSRVANTDQNAVLQNDMTTGVDWAWGGGFAAVPQHDNRIEQLMAHAVGSDATGDGQYIITPTAQGLVRVLIPNLDALSVVKRADVVADADPIWLHNNEATWFASLPSVG